MQARLVPNTHVGAPAEAGLLPDAARLERARDLHSRFAGHGLVRCAVVPSPIRFPNAHTWLAIESMQVTGSFKVRGAFLALEGLKAKSGGGALEVVAASAGNHGAGLAYAAKKLGVVATIVVPGTAPKNKVEKIAAYGANVIHAREPGYDGAEREAIALAKSRALPYVSPYDDLDVLTGNGASLGFEIAAALGRVPARVFCPLGGGGLATGLACALAHLARGPDEPAFVPRVIGIQTEASPAFALSLERGGAVTELPPASTLAEGLEGGLPERAFARVRAVVGAAMVVSEDAIAAAMTSAVRELGLVVEGSGAAALVPALAARGEREDVDPRDRDDVVIVLTGRNVDRERLAELC